VRRLNLVDFGGKTGNKVQLLLSLSEADALAHNAWRRWEEGAS
jgi:hypothetical protein